MGVAFAALIGLILGSFIATLVLRWPAGRSVFGRSQCDGCGRTLGVADLVPLLSAMMARGCCRTCRAAIDPFHWRVELGSGLIGGIALAIMPGTVGWMWALFGWMLLPLALARRAAFLVARSAERFAGHSRPAARGAVARRAAARPLDRRARRWRRACPDRLGLSPCARWGGHGGRRSQAGGGDRVLDWLAGAAADAAAREPGRHRLGACSSNEKGTEPLAQRSVPFGVFACTAAFATVPLWPLLSGR